MFLVETFAIRDFANIGVAGHCDRLYPRNCTFVITYKIFTKNGQNLHENRKFSPNFSQCRSHIGLSRTNKVTQTNKLPQINFLTHPAT